MNKDIRYQKTDIGTVEGSKLKVEGTGWDVSFLNR
jgi:hypothetical protein